jgi:hypothetical protein
LPSNLGRDLTNEADAFGMGATRPHNPAARGEPLGATAPWQNRSQPKKNKPTLNTKLRILPAPGPQWLSCGRPPRLSDPRAALSSGAFDGSLAESGSPARPIPPSSGAGAGDRAWGSPPGGVAGRSCFHAGRVQSSWPPGDCCGNALGQSTRGPGARE